MLGLAILCFFFVLTYGAYYEELVIKYEGNQGLWMGGYNEYFRGKSREEIMGIMGAKFDNRPETPKKAIRGDFTSQKSFNSAHHWPKCASTISHIKDQGDCGSCWAVAASEIAADRTCIANMHSSAHSDGLNEIVPLVSLSAEELMSCCHWCGIGCHGGFPIDAMRFWCWRGLVTGGWYGSNCGCQPYTIKPCGTTGCTAPLHSTPKCSTQCHPDYPISFKDDKHYCTDHYKISNGETGIMNEIGIRGPVECLFIVYENFLYYKSGIYSKHSGRFVGLHAVKIVGWGTDSGANKYWIINNSWNVTWGKNGVFWFKRGTDLCGMESECVAGTAKTGDTNYRLKCH